MIGWLCLFGVALAAPLGADEAVSAVLERDPALAAAEGARLAAEGAGQAACGLRQDPIVQAGVALVGDAWSVSLMQPISLSGEGAAACSSARAAAQGAAKSRDRAWLASAAQTRQGWAAAVAARQQRALSDDALVAAEAVLRATQARVGVGEAAELDEHIAHLHVERSRTAALRSALDEAAAVGALAARLGVAPDALELPADPIGAAPPAVGGPTERSDVAAAEAAVLAASSELRRARAASLPPARVGAFVEQEGEELRAGPRIQLTLPLWNRGVGARAAAEGALLQAEAQAEATRQAAQAEQATAGAAATRVEALLSAQDPDVPARARAALAGAAAAYAAGELDLLTVSALQSQILDGHAAWLEGRRLVAEARVRALLAAEDARLLAGP
jgi:outer membrane protein, heavy metal efflux system